MCVVMTTFGKPRSGWRPVAGDGLTTSNAAPASRPLREPLDDGGLVDERVAGRVDEIGTGLHPGDSAGR